MFSELLKSQKGDKNVKACSPLLELSGSLTFTDSAPKLPARCFHGERKVVLCSVCHQDQTRGTESGCVQFKLIGVLSQRELRGAVQLCQFSSQETEARDGTRVAHTLRLMAAGRGFQT